jgi:hypothetical protein
MRSQKESQAGQKDRWQARSERRGEAYFGLYVEPLSDARTQLADFFNILLSLCIVEDHAERKA